MYKCKCGPFYANSLWDALFYYDVTLLLWQGKKPPLMPILAFKMLNPTTMLSTLSPFREPTLVLSESSSVWEKSKNKSLDTEAISEQLREVSITSKSNSKFCHTSYGYQIFKIISANCLSDVPLASPL